MKSVVSRGLCLAVVVCAAAAGVAQEPPTATLTNDPRVGLKPGLRDAGVAIKNMELLSSLPKPDGFFDPKNPAGIPTPAEIAAAAAPAPDAPATPAPAAPAAVAAAAAAATRASKTGRSERIGGRLRKL